MSQSQGDILAQADGYVEPCGSDFAFRTWLNEFTSRETQTEKARRVSQECAEAGPTGPTGITCSIFEDTFSVINPADWAENNVHNIASPGPNGYEHLVHVNIVTPGAILNNQIGGPPVPLWLLGGNFDTTVEIDLTAVNGPSSSGQSGYSFNISETGLFPTNISFHVINNNSAIEYRLNGTGNVSGGLFYPTALGKHYLRFTRSGTTVTCWLWNSVLEQWEWNGNTSGWVHDEVWDTDILVTHRWSDTSLTDWCEGTLRKFCINAGTKI